MQILCLKEGNRTIPRPLPTEHACVDWMKSLRSMGFHELSLHSYVRHVNYGFCYSNVMLHCWLFHRCRQKRTMYELKSFDMQRDILNEQWQVKEEILLCKLPIKLYSNLWFYCLMGSLDMALIFLPKYSPLCKFNKRLNC